MATAIILSCGRAITNDPNTFGSIPIAVVPTLVHDRTVIIELTVINEYVDDAFLGPALRPADAIGILVLPECGCGTKQLDEGLHAGYRGA